MSVLANTEIDKLSVMYEGDKSRDASDKIRGFMFQDLVAIRCLLQDQVKYVCLEYLEDVDVFFEDDTIEVIQVKYYPQKTPVMKEISTDLYYQFLRFQMLSSTLKVAPRLYIYRKQAVRKPTVDKMKRDIGLGDKILKSVIYSEFGDLPTWLRENVYSTNKKEEQKKKLFVNMASEETLREFIEKFVVEHKTSINEYKKEVMEALVVAYPNPDEDGDEENWQLILLGIAISYIQKRYELEDSDFEKLRVDKKEFDQYMTNSVETKTEETIASYLTGLVCEKYGEIVNNNDKLSDLQVRMLSLIYKNTLRWINSIGKNVEGQYQLINTLSTWEASKVAGYKVKPIKNRCDCWDDRIRVFTIINGKSETIRKLKYNIVQLIVYSGDTPDKSREGNLLISRKIIIKGDMEDKNRIVIADDEAIELPFHMISSDAFAPNGKQVKLLSQLLPKDEKLLNLLKEEHRRVQKNKKEGEVNKFFKIEDYEMIKGWLENDNT